MSAASIASPPESAPTVRSASGLEAGLAQRGDGAGLDVPVVADLVEALRRHVAVGDRPHGVERAVDAEQFGHAHAGVEGEVLGEQSDAIVHRKPGGPRRGCDLAVVGEDAAAEGTSRPAASFSSVDLPGSHHPDQPGPPGAEKVPDAA